MKRILRVLAVDKFPAAKDEGSWLEWVVQKDKHGLFVMAEQPDGSVKRVNKGDFVITTMTGERHAFTQAEFKNRYVDIGTFVTKIEVP